MVGSNHSVDDRSVDKKSSVVRKMAKVIRRVIPAKRENGCRRLHRGQGCGK
jgi:hypothetical protein